jgi:hypothetical protein
MAGINDDTVARIRAEAAGLMASALQDDIEPDGTLGHWVRSQVSVLHVLADALEHLDRKVTSTIQNTRDLAIAEVNTLKEGNRLAHQTIEALRVTEAVLQLRTAEAVKGFMDTVTPQLVQALGSVAVVTERHWNQRQNWTRVSIVAAVLLGVFGIGYLGGGGNLQSNEPGEAAKAAVVRCREAAKPDRTTGEIWCPVKVLDALSG